MADATTLPDPAHARAGIFFESPSDSKQGAPVQPLAPANPALRHLLGLEGMPAHAIHDLLDSARAWRARWARSRAPVSALSGIEVCNAFFEDSTRTRLSFELAERRLGAAPLGFAVAGSSCSKGESLADTLRTIAAMGVDVIVLRHASSGAAAYAAREAGVPVVNAGDGAHEHPTQGLLDLLTLADAWGGSFEGRRVAIVGDVAHSRVARSAIHGLTALGARVTVAGPATLLPRDVSALACDVAPSIEDALRGADAVIALRLQTERMERGLLPSTGDYVRAWRLDAARARLLAPHAVVLHPGPINRDVEIASDVADGERSVVLRQVANGVAVRAAVLAWCADRVAA